MGIFEEEPKTSRVSTRAAHTRRHENFMSVLRLENNYYLIRQMGIDGSYRTWLDHKPQGAWA